jgi:ElaB/YqjD/DUF883 family membrane-anchored ribosome-binding protein
MLKKLFSRPHNHGFKSKMVVVVSGLPRSGTSMMMKMLAEGGLEIVSDTIRTADDDNPNGYFEFEPVKQLLEGNFRWLADANGKVVKIISSLLEYLPREYQYKIIFMERDLQEVLASQQKMLKNRQEQSQVEDIEMRAQFEKHLADIKYWLARQPNMDVLYISYNKMLAAPQAHCVGVSEFIGIPLDVEKMLTVPSANLYRNRAGKD